MYYKRKVEPIKAMQYNGIKDLEKIKEFVGDDEYEHILIRPFSERLVLRYGAEMKIGDYMFFDGNGMLVSYKKEKFEEDFESVRPVIPDLELRRCMNIYERCNNTNHQS